MNSIHIRKKLFCDVCDFICYQSSSLTKHKSMKHTEAKFSCTEQGCTFSTSVKHYLKKHTIVKHIGLMLSCDKCDYKSSNSSTLLSHKRTIHEKVKYPCSQCEQKFTCNASALRHEHSSHSLGRTGTDAWFVKLFWRRLKNHKSILPELSELLQVNFLQNLLQERSER